MKRRRNDSQRLFIDIAQAMRVYGQNQVYAANELRRDTPVRQADRNATASRPSGRHREQARSHS